MVGPDPLRCFLNALRSLLVGTTAVCLPVFAQVPPTSFGPLYLMHCAVCHGERLEGAAQGTPLVGNVLSHGDAVERISASISEGYPDLGMPGWYHALTSAQISGLAIYIAEQRRGYSADDLQLTSELVVPVEVIRSEAHDFVLDVVIDDLDPWPYSIEPLPDGRMLVTEKLRGLSVVSPMGDQSPLLEGAPHGYEDTSPGPGGLVQGTGWILDVAAHPDYAENGWIYLSYGHRCERCNALSFETGRPVSMLRMVRGRIREGAWVDEQVIWQADIGTYTPMSDIAMGGRIAFDPEGYVYVSLGMKGGSNYLGIQDLTLPYGKIHRMFDDGRVPNDNPFSDVSGAVKTTWTFGHRSPHGLEFDPDTRELWGTEMGPRGGDEVNLLLSGRNYGWPLYSKGVNYDGTAVDYGKVLGIKVDLEEIQQPIVDLTPSPAVSSFVIYSGEAFPNWRGQMILGTLKGSDLRRLVISDQRLVHTETLVQGIGRVRDVEVGPGGTIYLLLEHSSGGRIVSMEPFAGS